MSRVAVLGSGPGGYSAAFRAADLGHEVTLVERYATLGGVCLNVGCIPSKALLHTAALITQAEASSEHGIAFGEPSIDLDALRAFKDSVVARLTGGLAQMSKARKVDVVTGEAAFTSANALQAGDTTVEFDHCIIAAGSRSVELPGIPYDDERVMTSTGALELQDVPQRLLVVGGGIIGLEIGTVYDALGSKVTVVELTDGLIPGCDRDLVKPLAKRMTGRWEAIHLSSKVVSIEAKKDGLHASFEGGPEPAVFDRVLVAVGRRSNGDRIGAEAAGVEVDERGVVKADAQLRTSVPHIFAIGDVIGAPLLAHKAIHEGHVAAEVISGHNVSFEPRAIANVAYTDPEVAWAGLSENEAKERGIEYELGAFPWSASGRALGNGRPEGMTKLLFDPQTKRVLGGAAVGIHAGDLIAEIAHAIEMGSDAEDIALTIHPHPTLSETVGLSAEAALGVITDLPPKRKRSR